MVQTSLKSFECVHWCGQGRAQAHKAKHKSSGGAQKLLLASAAQGPPHPGNDDSAVTDRRSSSFQDALLEQLLALPSPAAK